MLRFTTLLAFTLLLLALVIPTRGAPLPQPSPSPDAVADALASRIAAINKEIGKIPVVTTATPTVRRNPKMPKNPKHVATWRRSLRLESSNEELSTEELASPLETEAEPTIVPALLVPRRVSNPKASTTKTFVTSTLIKVTKPTNPAANPKHTYIPPSGVVGAPTTHPGAPHPPKGSVISGRA